MRILRIRLKDFCGVSESEVRFPPSGVTIICGPNEAGKSTLMQAVDVLFDHRDDSRHLDVRRTKPVDRDVGSEAEADIQVGEYEFTYFKRFHKGRETRLIIRKPAPENLTGREAHDRVQQILTECVDTSLWRALRIVQGEKLQMPELHSQPALAQALDQAAGQAKAGEREAALFEAAHAEYLTYFTETGREREDPIGQARSRVSETRTKASELETQLNELETDLTRFSALERTVANLRRSLPGLEAAHKKAQGEWEVVSRLAEEAERAQAGNQLAEQAMRSAKEAVARRNEIVGAVNAAAEKLTVAANESRKANDALEAATKALELATTARAAASKAEQSAEADERVRQADHDYRREEFELGLMVERLGHVRNADAAAAAANAVVESTKITERLRTVIRDAELALKTSEGILKTGSPRLGVKALRGVSVVINGEAAKLSAGEERSVVVTESLDATLADMLELHVEPGASLESLQEAVRKAAGVLADACRKAGVASPEEAESAWMVLQEAKRAIADRNRVVKEHLRDLTREDLQNLIDTLHAKTLAYPTKRASALPLPIDLEEAKQLHDAAKAAATDAKRKLQDAEVVFAQVQENHSKSREEHAANAALLNRAEGDHAAANERLSAERGRASDEVLVAAQTRAEETAGTAQRAFAEAQARLKEADPDSAKKMLEGALAVLDGARAQVDREDRQLLELRTRLDLLGDKGLAEAHAEAARVAFEADDLLRRLLRRAAAAKLLNDTLTTERDAMRKAYVAPLREGIERLGRHVFGPSMRVDVDEKLQVVSRTLNGTTVGLEQLSTGAQEQLGILARLAAAQIVSKEGGVPLVLDDALGSTDEGRLESMGAVLRIASQDAQTIILTCAPERYTRVGAEQTIRLQ